MPAVSPYPPLWLTDAWLAKVRLPGLPVTLEIVLVLFDDASTITTSPAAQLIELTVTVALVVDELLPVHPLSSGNPAGFTVNGSD